jgi:hypothetical protein
MSLHIGGLLVWNLLTSRKLKPDSLLDFFEATEEISYQSLWDVPIDAGATALISTLNVDRTKGLAEINHTDDPDFIKPRESASMTRKNPRVMNMLEFSLPLCGPTSTTFVYSRSSQKYFTPTALVIPTTQTTIC